MFSVEFSYFSSLNDWNFKTDLCCVHCRAREAELQRQFQSDLANAEADYLQKTQEMVKEFGRAQQLLKDKIVKQQNMYVYLLCEVTKLWELNQN